MDRNTQTANDLSGYYRFADPVGFEDDLFAEPENSPAFEKTSLSPLFQTENIEAVILSNPLDTEKALSYFGFLLGSLGPLSIMIKMIIGQNDINFAGPVLAFGIAVTVLTTFTGYFTGKTIGRGVRKIEEYPLPSTVILSILLGLGWGMFTGGIGGLLIFGVGAIPGAIVGGIAGALALPPFVLLHRHLKTGDMIERAKFAPIAFGIILSLCSLLLGR